MKYFAGVGSRKNVPPEIAELISQISCKLEKLGYTLRSGGAEGVDELFASGVNKAQIWLPWAGFNSDLQKLHPNFDYRIIGDDPEAEESLKFHPRWPNLSRGVRLLMKRNFRIIKGLNEPHSSFVICWTPDPENSGTAQPLRISRFYNIPIFNLFVEKDLERIKKFLQNNE